MIIAGVTIVGAILLALIIGVCFALIEQVLKAHSEIRGRGSTLDPNERPSESEGKEGPK